MVEHVVIKNLKHDIRLALESPVRAKPIVTVEAHTLNWLVEQYEKQDYLKFLLKRSNLMYEIVTGNTSQAQNKLLQLYDEHPDFLALMIEEGTKL